MAGVDEGWPEMEGGVGAAQGCHWVRVRSGNIFGNGVIGVVFVGVA